MPTPAKKPKNPKPEGSLIIGGPPDPEPSELAKAIFLVASSIRQLGNGDACTHFGAIEGMSMKHMECSERIGESLDGIAVAIREGFSELAQAIRESKVSNG